MHEASDTYMGYAGKVELAAVLNELLEAERAGSKVMLESAPAAGAGALANLNADLSGMLQSYEGNIDLVSAFETRSNAAPY
jgi:hypothetical protein